MNVAAIPAIVYHRSPELMTLDEIGPRVPALEGAPVESFRMLYRDEHGRSGVWQCTPGRFESARNGDNELMHFIAGEGTITTADGAVHDIFPGAVLVAPDGWRGTWDIRRTVRKVYTIWTASTTPTTGETS